MMINNPDNVTQTVAVQLAQSIVDGLAAQAGGCELVDSVDAVRQLVEDLAAGRTVRIEGIGCHACRADTVCWIEHYDDPDTGETVEMQRIQTQHDTWCSYLRNRRHSVALRQRMKAGGKRRQR